MALPINIADLMLADNVPFDDRANMKANVEDMRSSLISEYLYAVGSDLYAERIYNYPYAAVEEALSNAIYHKSYQIGEPITVSITPDRNKDAYH